MIIYRFFAIIFSFSSLLPLCNANSVHQQGLKWVIDGGNTQIISDRCRQQILKIMDSRKPFAVESLLGDSEVFQLCYMAHFFSMIGKEKTYLLVELKDKEFVSWLLANPDVFEKLVFAKAKGKDVLTVLRNIWLKEGKNLSGIYLHMAIGAALISSSHNKEECVARYDFYKKSYNDKKLFSQFDSLQPWEMAILFKGRESIEELLWAQDYLVDKKKINALNAGGRCCGLIPYRMKNSKGISVHAGGSFYDHKPISLQIYVEYGGVCGAVSKGAVGFVKAKGIPSYTIGQPGHCAFVWKGVDGTWKIGNNIGSTR